MIAYRSVMGCRILCGGKLLTCFFSTLPYSCLLCSSVSEYGAIFVQGRSRAPALTLVLRERAPDGSIYYFEFHAIHTKQLVRD
jgi:hypothetical protein